MDDSEEAHLLTPANGLAVPVTGATDGSVRVVESVVWDSADPAVFVIFGKKVLQGLLHSPVSASLFWAWRLSEGSFEGCCPPGQHSWLSMEQEAALFLQLLPLLPRKPLPSTPQVGVRGPRVVPLTVHKIGDVVPLALTHGLLLSQGGGENLVKMVLGSHEGVRQNSGTAKERFEEMIKLGRLEQAWEEAKATATLHEWTELAFAALDALDISLATKCFR